MKISLRNYIDNYPIGITWKLILIIIITLQINSYLIQYYIIPSSILEELNITTNGLITSGQIAFIYSLLFYLLLIKSLRFPIPSSKKLLNNRKATFIVSITIVVLFTILFLINIDNESMKKPTIGFFIELLLGVVFEELFFRYFLLGGLVQLLKKTFGTKSIWIAIIGSSLIFSMVHLFYHIQIGIVQFKFYVFAFLIGIILSWIYIWFNNIILVIILHLVVNLNILYLPISKEATGAIILCWFIIAIMLARYGTKMKRNWS